jgi:hypothetical protein
MRTQRIHAEATRKDTPPLQQRESCTCTSAHRAPRSSARQRRRETNNGTRSREVKGETNSDLAHAEECSPSRVCNTATMSHQRCKHGSDKSQSSVPKSWSLRQHMMSEVMMTWRRSNETRSPESIAIGTHRVWLQRVRRHLLEQSEGLLTSSQLHTGFVNGSPAKQAEQQPWCRSGSEFRRLQLCARHPIAGSNRSQLECAEDRTRSPSFHQTIPEAAATECGSLPVIASQGPTNRRLRTSFSPLFLVWPSKEYNAVHVAGVGMTPQV